MSELTIERAVPVGALEPIGDGWTVYGMAVPYGVDQRVTDDGVTYYFERFEAGAFERDAAKGGRWVNLYLGHSGDDGDRWLGRCVGLLEGDDGLYPSFRLNREHPQAEAARSGDLMGWSVSARVYKTRRELGGTLPVVIRERCGLSHVAATALPQYAGAGVLVAREHVMVTVTTRTPRVDALRALGYGSKRA
jgi:HK97 family phage prohead protease